MGTASACESFPMGTASACESFSMGTASACESFSMGTASACEFEQNISKVVQKCNLQNISIKYQNISIIFPGEITSYYAM